MARWQEPMTLADLTGRRATVNAKRHDEPGIAASMKRFGYIEPIVLDERTGRIVGGHGRLHDLEARHTAGQAPPEGIELAEDGSWQVPVNRGWASADDAEATAAAVALNRLVERGGWDERVLLDQLWPFQGNGGLEGVGYSGQELTDLLGQFFPPDLGHLADKYGEPDPEALWLSFTVRLPPLDKARAEQVLASMPGDDDAQRFRALLDRAAP